MSLTPVLYAEDEPDDGYLMQFAFRRAAVANPLVILTDGQQVIEYLSGVGKYADRTKYPFPCLLLLDLKLPLIGGLEILKWISHQRPGLSLQVVVLSSSGQPSDTDRARALGAVDHITKPNNLTGLVEAVRRIKAQWLS